MTGYFARLARRTGLPVAGDRAKATISPAASRTEPRAVVRPAPLHVVETTLVELASGHAGQTSHVMPPAVPPSPDAHSRSTAHDATGAPPPVTRPPDSRVRIPEPARRQAATPTRSDAVPAADRPPHVDGSHDVGRRESGRDRDEWTREERIETRLPPGPDRLDVPALPYATPAAPDEAAAAAVLPVRREPPREDAAAREAIARRYLKDVRAWVAASPDIAFNPPSEPPAGGPVPQADPPVAIAPSERPTVHTGREAALDVQDLTLSIGSINLVIEEQRPPAAAASAPPRVETMPPQEATTPTALSRYYLRRW